MEQFSFAILVVLWIGILLWGSKYIEWMWVSALGFLPFRIFVAPGIVVHEYSHALACLLTGTKIHEIKLFKRDGGHVRHDRPAATLLGVPWLGGRQPQRRSGLDFVRFRFFSQFLISFAPVFGCLACIWLLGYSANYIFGEGVSPVAVEAGPEPGGTGHERPLLAAADESDGAPMVAFAGLDVGPPLASSADAGEVAASAGNLGQFMGRFLELVWGNFGQLIKPVTLNPLFGVLYLWLLLSLTIAMAPSGKDIMNALYGILAVSILLLLISMALASDHQMLVQTMEGVLPMMAYTTAVMLFALAFTSLVAPLLIGILRRAFR